MVIERAVQARSNLSAYSVNPSPRRGEGRVRGVVAKKNRFVVIAGRAKQYRLRVNRAFRGCRVALLLAMTGNERVMGMGVV